MPGTNLIFAFIFVPPHRLSGALRCRQKTGLGPIRKAALSKALRIGYYPLRSLHSRGIRSLTIAANWPCHFEHGLVDLEF